MESIEERKIKEVIDVLDGLSLSSTAEKIGKNIRDIAIYIDNLHAPFLKITLTKGTHYSFKGVVCRINDQSIGYINIEWDTFSWINVDNDEVRVVQHKLIRGGLIR